jgi:hypothetical protein
MATKATAGKGLVFAINTGTASSPTWTPVGESFDLTLNGKMNTDEATSYESTAVERIATMPDGGEPSFSCNKVSTNAGQVAMQTAYAAGTLKSFKVTAPQETGQATSGDSWAFSAIVVEFNPSFKPDKKIPISGKLAISNGITFTAGS